MLPSDVCCEKLETFAGDRHEFWDAGQIPIGIGDLGMADVGRERRHGVVDIGAMLVPELNAPADEGVAQVMDAHLAMAARAVQPRSVRSFWKTLLILRCAMKPPVEDRKSGESLESAP